VLDVECVLDDVGGGVKVVFLDQVACMLAVTNTAGLDALVRDSADC